MKSGCVYMMSNRKDGVIYIGVTSELGSRAHAHRSGLVAGFTKRYNCTRLVWFEHYDDLQSARHRELQMKEWRRSWKVELIEKSNPDWNDLSGQLI